MNDKVFKAGDCVKRKCFINPTGKPGDTQEAWEVGYVKEVTTLQVALCILVTPYLETITVAVQFENLFYISYKYKYTPTLIL
jgi:hypothetical protein